MAGEYVHLDVETVLVLLPGSGWEWRAHVCDGPHVLCDGRGRTEHQAKVAALARYARQRREGPAGDGDAVPEGPGCEGAGPARRGPRCDTAPRAEEADAED